MTYHPATLTDPVTISPAEQIGEVKTHIEQGTPVYYVGTHNDGESSPRYNDKTAAYDWVRRHHANIEVLANTKARPANPEPFTEATVIQAIRNASGASRMLGLDPEVGMDFEHNTVTAKNLDIAALIAELNRVARGEK